jgi:amino acid permease
MNKKFFYGVCTLAGTIIGVGLFSLPYIAYQSGTWIVLFYFIALGALVLIVHLLFGEVSLVTPDYLRFAGFTKLHLGKIAEKISLISIILGLFGANLAYLIIGGKFLNILLGVDNELIGVFLYFIFGSILIYFGIKAISKVEFWGLIVFFIILFIIFFNAGPFFKIENLFLSGSHKDLFLPYGPILFALWGAALIPEVEEMLGKNKKILRKIIFIAVLIPIITYLTFTFLVKGVTGAGTSQEAIEGLKNVLGTKTIILALFFGLLTTFTSFISIGLTLRKVFNYDLKINKKVSSAIVCLTPLALFLIGFKNFIDVISFVGGITIGIDGILIILMYQKIKQKKVPLFTYPLILIFVLGIIYQVIYFLK